MTSPLGDLFKLIRNGLNIKQCKDVEGLPITRIETISNGEIDARRVGYAGLSESACRDWLLEAGDILFSHINSPEQVGKCALYDGIPTTLVHGMNLLCLRADQTKLYPPFAIHLLRTRGFRTKLERFINKAVNQASVSIRNLQSIEVDIPSLKEQQRIAYILDEACDLRRKRQNTLSLVDELRTSLFLELMSQADESSSSVQLDDFADVLVGFAFPSAQYSESEKDVRLCRGANVLPGRIEWDDVVFWPELEREKYKIFELRTGDIVIAMDRPWISEGFKIAMVSEQDLPSLLLQRVARIRARNPMEAAYLYALLQGPAFTRHCRPTETTVPHISPTEIKRFRVPRLQPHALKSFADRIGRINDLVLLQRRHYKELESLFTSLEHRAFRGELLSRDAERELEIVS